MARILDRIQTLAQTEGITIGSLERKIGASKGVLSRAINNGTDIQSKWIQQIVEIYPQYSTRWLLTGEGPIFDKQESYDADQEYPHLLDIIRSQAEEIGRLKEQIRQLTVEKEKHVSHASTSGIASAG